MEPTSEPRRFRHFVHTPFTFEHQGVQVSCDEHGTLTLRKDNPEQEDAYDEIECQASLINMINKFLFSSKKIMWKDYPFKGEGNEDA